MKFESFASGRDRSDYTGHEFEEKLLPSISCGWDNDKYIKSDFKEQRAMFSEWLKNNIPDVDEKKWKFMRFEERREILIAWAKNNQPKDWNPAEPVRYKEKKPGQEGDAEIDNTIVYDLHDLVADHLGLPLENYDDLKFYTTLKTPADTLYGIDGLFELSGVKFTVDLTVNMDKAEKGVDYNKADFVLYLKDPKDKNELNNEAKRIAQRIKLKVGMVERAKQRAA